MRDLPAPTRPGVASFVILAGVVLAGGASRRMGRPKAFIELAGHPMVANVADALSEAGAERVVVVGGDRHRIEALGLHAEPDQFPGEGPLGGIISALRVCGDADAVAVLSCDLLAPSSAEVRRLAAELSGHDVVVPVVDDRGQWTHTIWSPRAVHTLESAFAAGERAPRQAVGDLSVRRVVVDGERATVYADADTPDDLPDEATP